MEDVHLVYVIDQCAERKLGRNEGWEESRAQSAYSIKFALARLVYRETLRLKAE